MHDERPDHPAPAPSGPRLALAAAIVLIVAGHLVAVTLAALPTNSVSQAARPATGYLGAYFAQNWRLFAPSPIAADRTVRFQGAYEVDGQLETTDWIDWTEVELDTIRHRLVGGRGGYVTSKAYGSLGSRYRGLDDVQRETADVTDPGEAPDWATFRTDLRADSQDDYDDRQVEDYLVYDRAFTALATQVLEGREPLPGDLVAVRYATYSQGVTPWSARGGSESERERARPTPVQRINGWRQPLRGDAAEAAAIAGFDRRHR